MDNSTTAPFVISSGDSSWMLTSSALVLLMTPGLGFFYGGLVRQSNVLNTILMSFVSVAAITIQFFLFGYSFAFGPGTPGFGNFHYVALRNVNTDPNPAYSATLPQYIFVMFQCTFAIITPALISGAVIGRVKYISWLIFIIVYATVVYDLLAHWMWSAWYEKDDEGNEVLKFGWLREMGAIDFAGGTVVHISSGTAGLVASIIIGRAKTPNEPHSVPFVLLGTALLWFGWFGFNGGSALNALDGIASLAVLNTQISPSAGFLTWTFLEILFDKKCTAQGAAMGAVVGLVAITPGCGFVNPGAAVCFGFVAAVACFFFIRIKDRLKYDDSLDTFGGHGIGGIVGCLLTGCFAQTSINPAAGSDGLFWGGGRLFGLQLLSVVVAFFTTAILTALILLILKYTLGLRPTKEEEEIGMDSSTHGNVPYTFDKITPFSLPASMIKPSNSESDENSRHGLKGKDGLELQVCNSPVKPNNAEVETSLAV